MPKMPNDAKLGLVVGLATLVLIAVVFFRREPPVNPSGLEATASVQALPVPRTPAP